MASITDKIRNNNTGVRPNPTAVGTARVVSGTSLVCDDLTGWATDTAVDGVSYKIDGQSKIIAGSQTDFKGIVTGNTINSFTVTGGTDIGNAIGDIVVALPTAAWGKDFTDAMRVRHNQDGSLNSTAATTAITATLNTGQVATNLRVKPRITVSASTASLTPNIDTNNVYELNAQGVALSIVNPTGTPNDGDVIILRLKDNGTTRTITYGTAYTNISGLSTLTTTIVGKWHVFGWLYNATLSVWQLVSVTTEA